MNKETLYDIYRAIICALMSVIFVILIINIKACNEQPEEMETETYTIIEYFRP